MLTFHVPFMQTMMHSYACISACLWILPPDCSLIPPVATSCNRVTSVWIMFPKNLSVTVLRRSLAASGDLVVGVRCLPQVLQLLLLGVLWERV